MRLLLSPMGSYGDMLPYLAIAKEAVARGHEVVVYGFPKFQEWAQSTGARYVPLSSDEVYDSVVREVQKTNPLQSLKVALERQVEGVGPFVEAMRADVVPGDTMALGGLFMPAHRVLAEITDTLDVTLHLAAASIGSFAQPPRYATQLDLGRKLIRSRRVNRLIWRGADRMFFKRHFTHPLNQIRSSYGLAPIRGGVMAWHNQAHMMLGLFPEWFSHAPDWPSQLVQTSFVLNDEQGGKSLPAEVEEFLAAGPAPVVFTAGTPNMKARPFFAESVEACRRTGLRGILMCQYPELVPANLPENVITVRYAPYSVLMSRAAVFVHHGGIGTMAQALRAGVPQLIRPVGYDQFDNSESAVRLGVARELLPRFYHAEALAEELREMVDDAALRARCAEVAARVRTECATSATRSVELLEAANAAR